MLNLHKHNQETVHVTHKLDHKTAIAVHTIMEKYLEIAIK